MQEQLVPGALGGVWQHGEARPAPGEMADGFHIGRAFVGAPAGALPVDHGLLAKASFGIVMRHPFGLRLGHLGRALYQRLGESLVDLPAGHTRGVTGNQWC